MENTLIVLGLAVIITTFIVVICAIFKKDIITIEVKAEKLKIKIQKDKHGKNHKNNNT